MTVLAASYTCLNYPFLNKKCGSMYVLWAVTSTFCIHTWVARDADDTCYFLVRYNLSKEWPSKVHSLYFEPHFCSVQIHVIVSCSRTAPPGPCKHFWTRAGWTSNPHFSPNNLRNYKATKQSHSRYFFYLEERWEDECACLTGEPPQTFTIICVISWKPAKAICTFCHKLS